MFFKNFLCVSSVAIALVTACQHANKNNISPALSDVASANVNNLPTCESVILPIVKDTQLLQPPQSFPDGSTIFVLAKQQMPHILILSSACAKKNFRVKEMNLKSLGECFEPSNNSTFSVFFGILPMKGQLD